jgi:hypothetical protein
VLAARAAHADQPAEVVVRGAPPSQGAASETTVGRAELDLRPRMRAEEVLEAVPGLFTVQHAGGGKAQQYFLRGFDADHGTDIAFFAEGVPLNAVSHAHGQGYTDLHFLIPETVMAVQATKGPYSARAGDFATAGSVSLRLADHADESFARGEVGPDGRKRALVLESPDLGDAWRALAAAEVFADDGHFLHPEEHRRFNAYARGTRVLDERSELSLTVMAYGATWNASGLIPERAAVSPFDSLDPSQGGASQRVMGSVGYRLRLDDVDVDATAYVVRSSLQLFLDDTLLASDPVHGDGTEQDDVRTVAGADLRVTRRAQVAGVDTRTTFGLQVRDDSIDNALYAQQLRQRRGAQVASRVAETELGAYVEEDLRPAPFVRFVLGARADRVDVAVTSADDSAAMAPAGARGGGLLSPKLAAVVSPARAVDLYADYGRGFHSNDARGVVGGATLLAVATGYEVGATVRPLPHLSLSAAAFLLDLTSELVFDGDTGTTSAAGATRREGLELTARYHFRRDLFADAALTLTRARFRQDDGSGTLVPLAPPLTLAAGIGAREPIGPFVATGALRIRSIADRPATRDGSFTAQGFTLVDAQASLRWKIVELGVEILNALDQPWREGQFAVTSRLPGEAAPVTGMSFTPGWPREIVGSATLYW